MSKYIEQDFNNRFIFDDDIFEIFADIQNFNLFTFELKINHF